jgi:hypothetical protein
MFIWQHPVRSTGISKKVKSSRRKANDVTLRYFGDDFRRDGEVQYLDGGGGSCAKVADGGWIQGVFGR